MLAGERALPVSFALLRAAGDETPLRAVASHPFALAQCARFLREHRLEAVEAASTAAAARELASAAAGTGIGALAPVTAAAVYGLRVEREGLEDETGPSTRFVVLRSRCPAPTGRDRTFFVVTPRRDEPGSLVRLLQEFSVRGINLTTIESRPTRALLGEYRFLIECEGHVADAHVRDAVLGLLRFPGETRFLGSFPEDPARRGHAPAAELRRRPSGLRADAGAGRGVKAGVVGLGLIGGSLLRALGGVGYDADPAVREAAAAEGFEVVGLARRPRRLRARARGRTARPAPPTPWARCSTRCRTPTSPTPPR